MWPRGMFRLPRPTRSTQRGARRSQYERITLLLLCVCDALPTGRQSKAFFPQRQASYGRLVSEQPASGASTYLCFPTWKSILFLVPLADRRLNILLTEDNSDDVFFFQNAFNKAGPAGVLHAVSDGLEALAYLSGEGVYADRLNFPFPDVLLLDLNMPRMNGFEVL